MLSFCEILLEFEMLYFLVYVLIVAIFDGVEVLVVLARHIFILFYHIYVLSFHSNGNAPALFGAVIHVLFELPLHFLFGAFSLLFIVFI